MTGKYQPKAVVFDKDGVLADSEWINVRSAFEIFGAHGHALEPADEAAIVGKHPKDYVPVFARRFGIGEADQRRIVAEQDAIYTRVWQEEGRLLDGARAALDLVRARGLPVGLATSSSRREVDDFLGRFDLASCFDLVLSLDDVERAKPDPEMYLLAARRLGVAPPEMLVIEDSAHGIRSAKSAGAVCIAVRTPHASPERVPEADAQIDSLRELELLLG